MTLRTMPSLDERTDAELAEALLQFEMRVDYWRDVASRRALEPYPALTSSALREAGQWSARAAAVRAEMKRRDEQSNRGERKAA